MEITKRKDSSRFCINTCLLDSKNSYVLLSSFMLGDGDGDKDVVQFSGKKINKELKNLILALEVIPDDIDDKKLMNDYLETPYSEGSYWSFQGYNLIFLDKSGKMFKCDIEFDENEKNIIKANNI